MERKKQYIAIDLKSFYASVECAERQLDPLDAQLVVADESRTDKTICLAVSPALKAHGIPGRPRLFEVNRRMAQVNAERRRNAPGHTFSGGSASAAELAADPSLESRIVIAPPRMAYYMQYSRRIVEIYLRYVAFEDLLVYSIDEVFIDATHYLTMYGTTAREFAMKLIREVLRETGITATAGVGTNLYLAKAAMDIVAKHIPPDADGVRIAELDEQTYRETLWCHRPLTDFWRVGRGISKKLEEHGIFTMGDIARCSEGAEGEYYNEDLLYRLFGVNAELLIDHAWGWEPTEIADCKAYVPEAKSLGAGQVLPRPYTFSEGRTVIREMADGLSMALFRKDLKTDQIVLDVGYDKENLADPEKAGNHGETKADRYGRKTPKPAHGSRNLKEYTSSTRRIMEAAAALYDDIVDPELTVRRFNLTAARVLSSAEAEKKRTAAGEQVSLFDAPQTGDSGADEEAQDKERRIQQALVGLRDKFGKNAVVKGLNMKEESTAVERNKTIGGHKA